MRVLFPGTSALSPLHVGRWRIALPTHGRLTDTCLPPETLQVEPGLSQNIKASCCPFIMGQMQRLTQPWTVSMQFLECSIHRDVITILLSDQHGANNTFHLPPRSQRQGQPVATRCPRMLWGRDEAHQPRVWPLPAPHPASRMTSGK